jgi:hypothetical protein
VRAQLQDARAALQGSLLVSPEAYAQLKRVPADRLLLSDAVKLAVHEALRVSPEPGMRMQGDARKLVSRVPHGWRCCGVVCLHRPRCCLLAAVPPTAPSSRPGGSQDLSSDNERLRLSASAARETSTRQAEELGRLQRDTARLEASLVRLPAASLLRM